MELQTYRMMRDLEETHWWFVARRRILAALLGRLGLPRDAELLEVGCGPGGNMRMLSRFGRLTCVESEPFARQLAGERGLAEVLPGELPDGLPAFSRRFDLVTVMDVLEHISDDRGSLRALAAVLNPGGRVLITVPAFMFLWSRHDEENHHQRRYNRKQLEGLVRQAGLQLDYISYFNFWLFPPVAAVRLLRKLVPYRESWQDMREPAAAVNGLLRAIFASERHVLGRAYLPFGMSLAAVVSAGGRAGPDA